ncbi:hypothetical protein ACSMXN_18740 [Jatrophihabitans sp. DSM 45814]
MYTQAASRTFAAGTGSRHVQSRAALRLAGVTQGEIKARIAAGRWRSCGRAIVMHNGPLTRRQGWDVALINSGPRAMLTAFTAAEIHGLVGWERDEAHVLTPLGTRNVRLAGLIVAVHRTRLCEIATDPFAKRCQVLPAALIVAATTFRSPRPACGICAAAVQQRLLSPQSLSDELARRPTLRHRKALIAAVHDIAGGSQALSEIDFVRLCRRAGLPEPFRQRVRDEPGGRRRYLDASWRRGDGRLVVAEVDGALHLSQARWWDDQHRQNELVLAEAVVLRFPSMIVRDQPELVVSQLRRALA